MADDDEIDILGDFSFNSCLAQNNQGIPTCSDRDDTVHPEWLTDNTMTNNWYDENRKERRFRNKIARNSSPETSIAKEKQIIWSKLERELLRQELAKYGRDIHKIAQSLKTKSKTEIQTLIDAEYGVDIDNIVDNMIRHEDNEETPLVAQEEVIFDSTVIPANNKKSNKTDSVINTINIAKDQSLIIYDDDLIIGSTESIGNDLDGVDILSKKFTFKQQRERVKAMRKNGYRRRVSRNLSKPKPRNKSMDILSSPQSQRKKSGGVDDSVKSPKMQIVLGSGIALPVSEGEEVIKIEKKEDEAESDIEIDIDSDETSIYTQNKEKHTFKDAKLQDDIKPKEETKLTEEPIAVPLRKFEPMPKRQKKKMNFDGGGGCTIMHTESGDLYQMCAEPRKERMPRKQPVHLLQCKVYSQGKPAPYDIRLNVSTLISMDVHAHTSRGEVMGLIGGTVEDRIVCIQAYRAAKAASSHTHCDMDPVSQSQAAEALQSQDLSVCGWHHSHPTFPCAPSALDLRTQHAMQDALERAGVPFLGFITSQQWPTGRTASQYRCIRVEEDEGSLEHPTGYQFSVKLSADVTSDNLPRLLMELREILRDGDRDEYSLNVREDVCPQAQRTYLEKCISSVTHHLRSAGYPEDDHITVQLVQGLRDVFR